MHHPLELFVRERERVKLRPLRADKGERAYWGKIARPTPRLWKDQRLGAPGFRFQSR